MKKRQKPYVGQQAFYREHPGDDPQACIVVYVGSDILVNAIVFTKGCAMEPRVAVNYWDGKGPEPTARMVSEE